MTEGIYDITEYRDDANIAKILRDSEALIKLLENN